MDKQTILIGIALVVVLGVVNIVYSSYFQIERIEIVGNDLLTDDYILNFSKISQKNNIFNVDQAKVEEKLLQLSQVKSVTIKRDLPSKLIVNIQERRPVAIIPFQSSYQVIDTEGWILQVTNNLSGWELPLITGVNIDSREERIKLTGKLEMVVNYLNKLPKKVLSGVNELQVTSQQKINLFLQQGGKVKLGSEFNIKRKAKVFTTIYKEIQNKNLDIKYIDLRYKENTFLKLE